MIFSLVRFGEFVLITGSKLLIDNEIKASGIASVETLSSDSGKVFSMDILCMKTMDVTGVTGNVLSLEFMSRATDPCGALLDLEIVGD